MAVRLYGALLRLLPRRVREADGSEMVATFAALHADAGRRRGAVALAFVRLPALILAEWVDHVSGRAAGPVPRAESGAMDRLSRSLRYAFRSLRRTPAFVWSVVLLLGLGVGSVTTIFTLVDHVILRPLPYPAADRLVELENGSHSGPTWRGLQDVRTVEAWGGVWSGPANMTGIGRPERLTTGRITENFLAMFGARPVRGRLLIPEDWQARDAVVISEGLWQRAFGGDEDVVGRTITLDGEQHVIVGVADPSFEPPEALTFAGIDVWRPVDWTDSRFESSGFHVLAVVGRLRPDASIAAAESEIEGLVARLAEAYPDGYRNRDGELRSFPLVPLQEATVGARVGQGLALLLGAVTLLLLVACTNVAHLFMARGISRIREMAVRRALGARTGSLAGQLLTESLLVGLAGAAVGVVLAYGGLAAFLALSPESIPRASAIRIDLRVLAFAVAIAAVTSLVFGMLPALRLIGRDVSNALHGTSRGNSETRRDRRLGGALVVAEVALSLVLVVQAGSLLRGFVRLNTAELGFRTEGVYTLPIEVHDLETPADWSRRMELVRTSLAGVPGVRMATYGMTMPLEWTGGARCCWGGAPVFPGADAEPRDAMMHVVDTDYFPLLDLSFTAGRPWTRAEASTTPAPAIVSEGLAVRVLGSAERAIGRTVRTSPDEDAREFRVVGVVAENRHYGPDQEHGEAMYMPAPTIPFPLERAHFAVLVDGPSEGLATRLREAVWAVEPDLPVPIVRSLPDWAGEATARARFEAVLFASFGGIALLLVAGGLYGTLLYAVGRRRRELGIRLALGDAPARLERRVLGQGVRTAIAGCAFGALGAWALGRVLASRLSGLDAGDPVLLGAAITILVAVALTASWLPARRAARTDPLEALRSE